MNVTIILGDTAYKLSEHTANGLPGLQAAPLLALDKAPVDAKFKMDAVIEDNWVDVAFGEIDPIDDKTCRLIRKMLMMTEVGLAELGWVPANT